MTISREASPLPAFLALSLLVASLLPAGANDTAFGGSAASPYPVHTSEIRMVSENITIKSDAKSGAWLYTCDFVFENLSEDPVTIMMGMPFFRMSEGDEDFIASQPSDEQAVPAGKPMVWNFTATVDGRSVPVTEGTPTVNDLSGTLYRIAYTWPMRFDGRAARGVRNAYKPRRVPRAKRRNHSIRRVRNTYKLGYTYSLGDSFLDYILKTGGLWHDGRIGRSRLRVILDDPHYVLPKKNAPLAPLASVSGIIKPAGYKITGGGGKIVIEWDLRNFAPKEDLKVVFRLRELFIRDYAGKMKDADPRKLRNLPYAAHGYPFKDQGLRDYFATLLYPRGNKAFKESDFSKNSRKIIATANYLEAKDNR
jgi:hypothetical protein